MVVKKKSRKKVCFNMSKYFVIFSSYIVNNVKTFTYPIYRRLKIQKNVASQADIKHSDRIKLRTCSLKIEEKKYVPFN